MKKMQKMLVACVLILLLISLLPVSVYANSPAPADYLYVLVSDKPDDAVYAELLIKIDTDDINYVDFQPNAHADDVSSVRELIEYNVDGYRSFTFHYKDAKSNMEMEDYYDDLYIAKFCNIAEHTGYLTQYEDLRENYHDIKIALMDKDYKILTVSDAGQIPKEKPFFVFYGGVTYNVSDGSITADEVFNPYSILYAVVVLLSVCVPILLSAGIEVVAALLFKFKGKQLLTVFLANLSTQIAMYLLYAALPFTYLIETIILEVLVYLTEFFVYKKCFKQMSTGKILLYTVVANTVSLLLGLAFYPLVLA